MGKGCSYANQGIIFQYIVISGRYMTFQTITCFLCKKNKETLLLCLQYATNKQKKTFQIILEGY